MAILIDMDMPESCLSCIFHDSPEFDVFCELTNKYVADWNDAEGVKPDWCPLREVFDDPRRRAEHCKSCVHYDDGLLACGGCGVAAGTIHTKYERRKE